MKTYLRPTLFFIAVLLICLMMTLPASQVLRMAPQLPPSVTLGGASGTLWQGELSTVRFNGMHLSPLRWSIQVLPLILGRLQLSLEVPAQSLDLKGVLSHSLFGRTVAKQLFLRFPVSEWTQPWIPRPFGASGELNGSVQSLQLDDQGIQEMEATFMWSQATIMTPEPLPLGNVRIELSSPKAHHVVGDIVSDKQQLEIQLSVELTPDTYNLSGFLKPVANSEISAESINRILGRPNRNGEYRLQYKGSIEQLKAFL